VLGVPLPPSPQSLSLYIVEPPYFFPSHPSSLFSLSCKHECLIFHLATHFPSRSPTSSSTTTPNANLFNTPQLWDDDSSSRPQLPTDLNGSPINYPSSKSPKAIPTFSKVVKLRVGSVSGGSVSRNRSKCNVYPTSTHLESTNPVFLSESVTLEFDLASMSLFGKIWGGTDSFSSHPG